jgi:UDP-2,3-diacylglucosamine hydrolase
VPAYFASDVHLRLDRPDRSRRFARFVSALEPADSLTIPGDLCDFWFAARQLQEGARSCPALQALAAFRDRGGAISILPGNHDAGLGSFYESTFGARFQAEPLCIESHGLRLHLVHGHLLGGQPTWKSLKERPEFLSLFRRAPARLANVLDRLRESHNHRHLLADEERHLAIYRRYAASLRGEADVVVIGHVHRPVDDFGSTPRLIVLGGWLRRSSYLKIDHSGASLVIEHESASIPC